MPDNKTETGKRDRNLVAGGEDWEVNYVAHKYNTTAEVVQQAIEVVGNNRDDVEAYLQKQQSN